MRPSGSTAVATLVLALLMALLAGCTGGDGSGRSDSGGAGPVFPGPAAPGDDTGGGEEAAGGGGSAGGGADADRQVVATATASVVVDDPAEGAERVSELVAAVGGRVEERTERASSDEEDAAAALVVRVPADELDGVLDDLDDVGDVEGLSVTRSDVTAAAVDLDARIAALQTSVARLLTLLDGAADTEALLAVESTLADRQGHLESLQSQRAFLADQVDLSTLTVHLAPPSSPPAGGPDGFVEGLGAGWGALGTAYGGALLVLGVLLPWLLVAAPVAGIAVLLVRRTRRRPAVATTGASDEPAS